jgi:hypothetical protein
MKLTFIAVKKRDLAPSYIAHLGRNLNAAFEEKEIVIPAKRSPNSFIGLKVMSL